MFGIKNKNARNPKAIKFAYLLKEFGLITQEEFEQVYKENLVSAIPQRRR